ncbi:MAG: RagB/SusD family nutrient uptake outer membrane protein, partial [Hydrotalea flava]|nr:RagB/SusD family nutrient uptake outer membrane protein [Hydrotalea flava]NIM37831.1 RagB/SusD family nutrient uptake outer membrane protein [Hydrotalea flava]NIN03000.1 RagB/SusD family nutrient uptake outer membrane protein [Hydrotalea flava]NIN14685.1 RagB/SusD family nutrient uptake outer membrane protein [Hydrotalea flava]NIO93757.1 RagB/SusD family nutrient uptake outer membrane protein [Hydrotalea flava]
IYQTDNNNTGNQFFSAVNGIPSASAVKAGTCPSQELVDSYEMVDGTQPILGYSDNTHLNPIYNPNSSYDPNNPYKNRDPRLAASIFCNGNIWGNINGVSHTVASYVGGADGLIEQGSRTHTRTGYYIAKWIDTRLGNGNAQVAQNSTDLHWTIFRLAEFYLNYAEAMNEVSGPTQEVYNAVNKIRSRAGIANLPGGLSQDQMRNRIHNERRVELAFEEHRFYDVRRWKILDQTDRLVTGMKITPSSTGNSFSTNLYNPSSGHSPLHIDAGTSVAVQFSANQPFNYVGATCPGYGTNTGGLTFTLYNWDTDFSTTIAGIPIGSIDFTNFADNSTLIYTSSTILPVGNYLLLIHNPVNNVGVWQHPDSGGTGVNIFVNGNPATGSFESLYGYKSMSAAFNYQRILVENRSAYDSRFLVFP